MARAAFRISATSAAICSGTGREVAVRFIMQELNRRPKSPQGFWRLFWRFFGGWFLQ